LAKASYKNTKSLNYSLRPAAIVFKLVELVIKEPNLLNYLPVIYLEPQN